jgi:hypothetical protein
MKFYERFWKYMPYVSAGMTGLSMLGKGAESLTGLAGWLSGETYTGDGTYSARTGERGFGGGTPFLPGPRTKGQPIGAFGGFESTAKDWLTSQGWNTAGNVAGHTINLLGEILSAPIELGLQSRDYIQKMKAGIPKKGFLEKGWGVVSEIGGAYRGMKEDEADRLRREKGRGIVEDRIQHRQIPSGSPAQVRKLAQARQTARRQQQENYYGGVYDAKTAQLMQYAFHELNPTIIKEMKKTQLARSYYDVGSAAIGRGRGIG